MYRSILLAITTIFLIAATGAVAVAQSELSAPAPVTIEISDLDIMKLPRRYDRTTPVTISIPYERIGR